MGSLPRTLALGLLMAATAAHATTITVTSDADSGANTLRQAIVDANADVSPDPVTIAFDIGMGGDVSIAPHRRRCRPSPGRSSSTAPPSPASTIRRRSRG